VLAGGGSCGGHGSPASPSAPGSTGAPGLPAIAAFSRAPLDLGLVSSIAPIGNLNPPEHTLPTNHAYFFHPSVASTEVVAPAGGTVQSLTRGANGADDQIYVTVTSHVAYYLYHLRLDAGIAQNAHVDAGQRLGVTASASTALDLGVIDDTVALSFVRPERYIAGTLHAASPFRYFDEPVKSDIYAKVNRAGSDKDGRIDFDQAGRLSGNWFTPDLAVASTESIGSGSKQLVFARDAADPSRVRISIGGTLAMPGAWYVQNGAPDPADVSPAGGPVSYQLLYAPGATQPAGVLLAEMLTDSSARVEAFPAVASADAFTGAAVVYVR
jgi:hypothetical protein